MLYIKLRYYLFLSILLFPWIFVFFLRSFGPLSFESLTMDTKLFIFIFLFVLVLSYSFSYFIGGHYFRSFHFQTQLKNNVAYVSEVFILIRKVLFFSAVMYVIFSFYDYFLIKGAAISEIIMQREKEHLTGPRNSLIGALVSLLSASTPIALVLFIINPFKKFVLNAFFWLFVILGFFSMFLSGGRNAFFISVAFVLVFSALYFDKKIIFRSVSPRLIFLILLMLLIGFFYSLKMFVDRFLAQGMPLDYMILHLVNDYNVDIAIPDYDGFPLVVYSVWSYLVFYITHALNYLDQYFYIDYSPFLKGVYNFPLIARLFDFLFSSNIFESSFDDLLLRGVYLSLPGSIYVDFGVIGSVFVAAFLGFVFGALVCNYKHLILFNKFLLTYLCVTFLFAPFFNIANVANGFSFLFFLIIIFLCSLKLKRDFESAP